MLNLLAFNQTIMITLIAAAGENNELGKLGYGNNSLWDLPDDYQRFKELTYGHPVIMGRQTFGTLTDILTGRLNIILTRNPDFVAKGAETAQTMQQAIDRAKQENPDIFIIGGGEIFKLGIGLANRIELTRIHSKFPDANTFFPEFSEKDWKLERSVEHPADDRHKYSFSFQTWIRK